MLNHLSNGGILSNYEITKYFIDRYELMSIKVHI